MEIRLDNSIMFGVLPFQNRSAHDQSIDYGAKEWWRLSAVMKLEPSARDGVQASRVAIEKNFVLQPLKAAHDVGFGLFAALEASIHDDENLVGRGTWIGSANRDSDKATSDQRGKLVSNLIRR